MVLDSSTLSTTHSDDLSAVTFGAVTHHRTGLEQPGNIEKLLRLQHEQAIFSADKHWLPDIQKLQIVDMSEAVLDQVEISTPLRSHNSEITSSFRSVNPVFGVGVSVEQAAELRYSHTASQHERSDFRLTTSSQSRQTMQPLVGIIDTGFRINAPHSQVLLGSDHVDGDQNPLFSTDIGNEHGTQILNVVSKNQNAPLWLGRAVGSGQWAESLIEFVDSFKSSDQSHAVVNLSFDLVQTHADGSITPRYHLTDDERSALEYAHQHGVLVVVAAGNTSQAMSALGQAAQEFDNIIAVGAADVRNRASYSSYGKGLTLLANGEDDGVIGTSIAAAKVTNVVTSMWSTNPELSYRQIVSILKSTATDLNTPGWDHETGAGLLDQTEAINKAALTTPDPLVAPKGITSPILTNALDEANASEQAAAWWNPIDWAKSAWNKIKEGATWVYNQADDKLIGSFERTIEWGKKFPTRFKQLGTDFEKFVTAVGKGDFEGAGVNFGKFALHLQELSGTPEALETIADWLKINTRPLNNDEIAAAKSVFGDSINYSLVRVDEWSLIAKVANPNGAITTLNTINSWGGNISKQTLIHELAHVWQYQHTGIVYGPEALYAQAKDGQNKVYDYGGVAELQTRMRDGRGMTSFDREKQAEIVEDYYRIKSNTTGSGQPDIDDDIYLSVYAHFVQEFSTLSNDQLSLLPTDSGDSLNSARNLQLLSTLNNSVTLRESVGGSRLSWSGWRPTFTTDETDVYRLKVTSGNLKVDLSNMTADADLRIIQDTNNNGVIDTGEIIAASTRDGSQDDTVDLTGLTSGDYFIKVDRFSGMTSYNLGIVT